MRWAPAPISNGPASAAPAKPASPAVHGALGGPSIVSVTGRSTPTFPAAMSAAAVGVGVGVGRVAATGADDASVAAASADGTWSVAEAMDAVGAGAWNLAASMAAIAAPVDEGDGDRDGEGAEAGPPAAGWEAVWAAGWTPGWVATRAPASIWANTAATPVGAPLS